jgi:hypothetical protein
MPRLLTVFIRKGLAARFAPFFNAGKKNEAEKMSFFYLICNVLLKRNRYFCAVY